MIFYAAMSSMMIMMSHHSCFITFQKKKTSELRTLANELLEPASQTDLRMQWLPSGYNGYDIHSSAWFVDGSTRNRWFTELNSMVMIFHGELAQITRWYIFLVIPPGLMSLFLSQGTHCSLWRGQSHPWIRHVDKTVQKTPKITK